MWHAHDGMGWWMVFGGILWIIFWATVIGLAVWGIARLLRSDRRVHRGERDDALEIARTRYARGEITREQFDQIKKDLG